jgi:hypothetical protein
MAVTNERTWVSCNATDNQLIKKGITKDIGVDLRTGIHKEPNAFILKYFFNFQYVCDVLKQLPCISSPDTGATV